jgi:hypothetical protein
MYTTITYDQPLAGNGRNGTFKCAGVEVIQSPGNDYILLAALTTRGSSNSCWFEIPVDKINGLIAMLEEARDRKKREG